MKSQLTTSLRTVLIGSALFFTALAQAESTSSETDSTHGHGHEKSEAAEKNTAADGHFEDSHVKPRELADWQGDWQSVYPFLLDGTLDPVMADKAEEGDKSAEQYREYYETGYKTEVDHIDIGHDSVTFHTGNHAVSAGYASDGFEILTYESGNRGVRYVFRKHEGDDEAPAFIQFSDHLIEPTKAEHYHLYWGDDRAALLTEVTNWPTYFPSSLEGEEIAAEMMAH